MDKFKTEPVSPHEAWRWETAETKEPGTIRWLDSEVRPGDVVYDIGANVGVYTLRAALLVGDTGRVYAFEPHIPTAKSLMSNLGLNDCGKRVTVLTCALHETDGFFPFHYFKMSAGTSGHQLDSRVDEFGRDFTPIATELKYAATVARLIRLHVIEPATLIKLDVDGNEPLILKGMEGWFPGPLRMIQVEMHPRTEDQVYQFMERYKFRLSERHYTEFGQRALAQGYSPGEVAYNAIFAGV